MRDLYNYIKESLLDDDDEIMSKGYDAGIKELFKDIPSFRISSDFKWILFEPERPDYDYDSDPIVQLDRPDGDVAKRAGEKWRNDDVLTDDLFSNILQLPLKFQPIEYYNVPNNDKMFHKLPVDYVSMLSVTLRDRSHIDLSKVEFDIKTEVTFTINTHFNNMPEFTVTPYPKHIPVVLYTEYGFSDNPVSYTPDMVKGWDCDILAIQCPIYKKKGSGVYNDMQDWDKDIIQQFVVNNPKAKAIYCYEDQKQNSFWYKVKIKGTGRNRQVIEMTPLRPQTVLKKIYKYRDIPRLAIRHFALGIKYSTLGKK